MAERKINARRYVCTQSVPAYSVVAITGTETKAQGRRVVYTVEQTTSTSATFGATGRFDGSEGALNASEDMLVRYTGTLAVGDRVRPKTGDWVIEKNSAGNFVVVGLVEKDSLQLASIRLDPIKGGLRLIKAPTGGIPGRQGSLMGSAACSIVTFDAAGQLTVSGDSVTVFNWAMFPACKNGDRYGVAAWINSSWLVVSEDCTDEGSTNTPQEMAITGGYITDLVTFDTISPMQVLIAEGRVGATTPTGGSGVGFA